MKQIPLSLAVLPQRSFDNFVVGANIAAWQHLRSLEVHAPPVYLWGPAGCGKSHLLQALAHRLQASGARAGWYGADAALPWPNVDGCALLVFDECDRYDAERQQAAFALIAQAADSGTVVAAAGRIPPVDLPLREDLRTRLAWGHVFALQPLSEAEVRAVLRRESDSLGAILSDEVMDYLLTRFQRDLRHLTGLLDRLNHYSLAEKRNVTVPLVKRMLASEDAPGRAP